MKRPLPDRVRFELRLHRAMGLTRWPSLRTRAESPEPGPTPEPVPMPEAVAASATASRAEALRQLEAEVRACTACRLCEERTHAVPGEGALDPPILFIGEGPGADEDRTGRPFVGRAGQLLDKMILAIQYQREQVYIANVVKCRPPGNRTPLPDEIARCRPFLERQIDLLRPAVICTLGSPATKTLLPEVGSISRARGRAYSYRNIPVVPTFHPAYLLRNPPAKRDAWNDLQHLARLAAELRSTRTSAEETSP